MAPEADKDIAGASDHPRQLFATAFGAALAGMIANLAGLNDPGGAAGAAHRRRVGCSGVRAGAAAGGIQRLALRRDPRRRPPRQAILYPTRPRASARAASPHSAMFAVILALFLRDIV